MQLKITLRKIKNKDYEIYVEFTSYYDECDLC